MKSIILICLIFSFALSQKPSNIVDGPKMYEILRNGNFTALPESIGITHYSKLNQVYGVIMEVGLSKGHYTLTSYNTGDASIYFSSGGGIIGGFAHEKVRNAAINFVEKSDIYASKANVAITYRYPKEGEVLFYFFTKTGKRYLRSIESKLADRSDDLSELYVNAHAVITELRLIQETSAP